MKSKGEVLRLQIAFCEAYLKNHATDDGSSNFKEVHDYVSAQLALALSLLTIETQVAEANRTAEVVRGFGNFNGLPEPTGI